MSSYFRAHNKHCGVKAGLKLYFSASSQPGKYPQSPSSPGPYEVALDFLLLNLPEYTSCGLLLF